MDENNQCLSCVDCRAHHCFGKGERYPDFCPTVHKREVYEKAMEELREPENNRVAIAAAEVEYEGYGRRTRVEEALQFAHKLGAKKIGIATCLGLASESRMLARIFRLNGFEVHGAICKAGATPKAEIGIPKECEAVGVNMCNPILQAELLNDAGTDLNLIVGLCVGHDSLFMKHSNALCTSVITKDRILGHNPAVALYQAEGYYSRLLEPQFEPEEE